MARQQRWWLCVFLFDTARDNHAASLLTDVWQCAYRFTEVPVTGVRDQRAERVECKIITHTNTRSHPLLFFFFPTLPSTPLSRSISVSPCWWLINIGWQSCHYFSPALGKENIRLHIWILCMRFPTKARLQSPVAIQVHNDTNNMVELMHYNSCLFTASWKRENAFTVMKQLTPSPLFNIRNSMVTFQFSPLWSEQHSKNCWLPPAPTRQLSESHNGEESSTRDLWVPWRSRHLVGLPDCPWFQFRIIGDLQVGERIFISDSICL